MNYYSVFSNEKVAQLAQQLSWNLLSYMFKIRNNKIENENYDS